MSDNNETTEYSQHLQGFIALFGSNAGHRYQASNIGPIGNGQKAEATYFCVVPDPDEEDYERHLNGEISLSILLNRSVNGGPRNMTIRCAVDIDEYGLDPQVITEKLQKLGIVPVLTISKSGGIHVHLFFDSNILCKEAREFASRVGPHVLQVS